MLPPPGAFDWDCAATALPSVSYSITSNEGDLVRVLGTIAEVNGSTSVGSVSSITVLDTVTLPTPLNVSTGDLGGTCSATNEAYESVLVEVVKDVLFMQDYQYRTHIDVTDGSGALEVCMCAVAA